MNPAEATSSERVAWGNGVLLLALGVLVMGLLGLQTGEWEWHNPGMTRWLASGGVLLAWSGFTAWNGWQRRRSAALRAWPAPDARSTPADVFPIVYASQTGTAEQLAHQTAESLRQAGMTVRLLELGSLDVEQLAQWQRVLFIVSTTGEGDAPDSAASFVSRWMRAPLPPGFAPRPK